MYERLGFIGLKKKNGKEVKGYLQRFKDIPNKLCSNVEFRTMVAGDKSDLPSIIIKNDLPYGIPQGAPISDIIANFYLIDFDILMQKYATEKGGVYMRYSDDIIVILPGEYKCGEEVQDFIINNIKNYGDYLKVKESKCSLVQFRRTGANECSYTFIAGEKGKNGLEYLGSGLIV